MGCSPSTKKDTANGGDPTPGPTAPPLPIDDSAGTGSGSVIDWLGGTPKNTLSPKERKALRRRTRSKMRIDQPNEDTSPVQEKSLCPDWHQKLFHLTGDPAHLEVIKDSQVLMDQHYKFKKGEHVYLLNPHMGSLFGREAEVLGLDYDVDVEIAYCYVKPDRTIRAPVSELSHDHPKEWAERFTVGDRLVYIGDTKQIPTSLEFLDKEYFITTDGITGAFPFDSNPWGDINALVEDRKIDELCFGRKGKVVGYSQSKVGERRLAVLFEKCPFPVHVPMSSMSAPSDLPAAPSGSFMSGIGSLV